MNILSKVDSGVSQDLTTTGVRNLPRYKRRKELGL
jgi:hypothetical protein